MIKTQGRGISAPNKAKLKQLAIDIHEGLVFHDRMLSYKGEPHSMVMSVFMPLALMNKDVLDELIAAKPVLFYEYYSEAGPRSVNGCPMFATVRYLNQEELTIMVRELKRYEARHRRFMVPWWRRLYEFLRSFN